VAAEVIANVYKAGETLSPVCRRVFKKLYVESKGIKETAEELDLSVSTVKTQKKRAILKIVKKLSR
jgi:RNA polymerase sigma-70 factor (ECF subfamily)